MLINPDSLPGYKGKLLSQAPLAPYTWFRVGGPAELLALPADAEDLARLLHALPPDTPLAVLGVGSNTLVRDGGIDGLTVRLMGRAWAEIAIDGANMRVGAGALDLVVARAAATAGLQGLSFLSGIPGSLGGAVRTNAGCYGRELKDVLSHIEILTRQGQAHHIPASDIGFSYRHCDLPEDWIIAALHLRGEPGGDPAALLQDMADLQARRADSQPIREKTGGSTFANPDPPGTEGARSSWKLIEAAGCRGLRVGGAEVSPLHCNFLINRGEATAADIEALGELVRARVLATSGVDLRWEIRRVGKFANTQN